MHDDGSSHGLNDCPDVKLHSVGVWCLSLTGSSMAEIEDCVSFDFL